MNEIYLTQFYIAETAMGQTVNAQEQTDSPYINAIAELENICRKSKFQVTVQSSIFQLKLHHILFQLWS
jgi:hypothetical protein